MIKILQVKAYITLYAMLKHVTDWKQEVKKKVYNLIPYTLCSVNRILLSNQYSTQHDALIY
jgi:hypothetical protein